MGSTTSRQLLIIWKWMHIKPKPTLNKNQEKWIQEFIPMETSNFNHISL
jgi:hypothetical protein